LAKFVTTVRSWWEEMINYFIARRTNGFGEGLTAALRAIMRILFGYRNFINFKLRAFAQLGAFHADSR
jgi:transposase